MLIFINSKNQEGLIKGLERTPEGPSIPIPPLIGPSFFLQRNNLEIVVDKNYKNMYITKNKENALCFMCH